MTVDFDKVMRGPGFWKFNNSHLESDRFKEMVRMELMNIVYEHQINQKDAYELVGMSPQQLQEIELKLSPHELMEQIHYILKAKIIKYSKAIQKRRRDAKKTTELEIKKYK